MVIHCAKGKDRTGVLAALLQSAAGDPEAEIVEAYALSESLLDESSAPRGPPEPPPQQGVDWAALRGSPAEAMRETLRWVEAEYGSPAEFIRYAGCGLPGCGDEAWRKNLRRGPPR